MTETVDTKALLAAIGRGKNAIGRYMKAGLEPAVRGTRARGGGHRWIVADVKKWLADNGYSGRKGQRAMHEIVAPAPLKSVKNGQSVKTGHSGAKALTTAELWADAGLIEDPLKRAQAAKTILQAQREEMKAKQDQSNLVERGLVAEGLAVYARSIRMAGEQLEREYGKGANEILQEALAVAEREVEELL